jgi:hypothetical protein
MKTSELDLVFISYDEPNADLNYSDLVNKAPWAKRLHGVKGSDAAHKEAAKLSDTDFFITVDADNIVDDKFFHQDLNMSDQSVKVYGWCGYNKLNGLRYGNGGIKIWNKYFVLNMKTHEAAEKDTSQVDFCWEEGYKNFAKAFSVVDILSSPKQAWRAGFREGVKMTLKDGIKVDAQSLTQQIWWHNLHRLRMWSTVGAHEKNGIYAIYGARLGTWLANCTDWNYIEVRDFEILNGIWNQYGRPYEEMHGDGLETAIKSIGEKIKHQLGLDWPWLDSKQSQYVLDLYNETINLSLTYHMRDINV